MSCQSIQKLIPLYVADDLPGRQTARVRRHVEGCGACQAHVEGYRLSQRWLRSVPAPEVGGAALEGLRRSVWKRIASEPRPPAAWRQVERAWAALRHWAAQPAMATLALFVVVTGSFALSRVTGPIVSTPSHRRVDATGSTTSEPREDPAAEGLLARSADDGPDGVEPSSDVVEPGLATDESLRIEIQTRDPDVRIIWFSPTEDRAPPVED